MFISNATELEVRRLRAHVQACADHANERTFHDGSESNSYKIEIAGVVVRLFESYSPHYSGYTFWMSTDVWSVANGFDCGVQLRGGKKQYWAMMADIAHMKRFGDLGAAD